MAEGQDDSPSKKWSLTVKTPKEKKTVEVEENATVKDVSFNHTQHTQSCPICVTLIATSRCVVVPRLVGHS